MESNFINMNIIKITLTFHPKQKPNEWGLVSLLRNIYYFQLHIKLWRYDKLPKNIVFLNPIVAIMQSEYCEGPDYRLPE